MKKKIYIFGITAFFTYFIFTSARASAVASRGNNAIGGEFLLWLLPAIAVLLYQNVILSRKVNRELKAEESNSDTAQIRIVKINKIEEVN